MSRRSPTEPPTDFEDNGEHLTRAMRTLLVVLMDIGNAKLSVPQKCKLAGISPARYYQIMKLPWFKQAVDQTFMTGLVDQVFRVREALIASASQETQQGAQDRRTFFELLGHLKREVKHSGEVKTTEPIQLMIVGAIEESVSEGAEDAQGPG